MDREDLGAGREHLDGDAPGGQAGVEEEVGGGPSADLVASTVEALRARVDDAQREGLRGTIDPHAPLGERDPR